MSPHHELAAQFGLRIAQQDDFTIARRKRGDGWRFIDTKTGRSPGREVTTLLRGLAIPPAWSEVRCAKRRDAHILVTGTDGEGRRQYIYNPEWERVREAVKEARLLRFGKALPRIRERVRRDLAAAGRREGAKLRRKGVAAVAARLLDRAGMRPGNEAYALTGTRGASTLRRDDVRVNGTDVKLDYVGKHGREHEVQLRDAQAARVLRRLKRTKRQGRRTARERLFIYRGQDGRAYPLTAAKLNRYLVDAAGEPVSAKDFRTFIGSATALETLFDRRNETNGAARKKAINEAVDAASERLRNTPAVARSSYIMPTIIAAYERDELADTLFRGPTRRGLDRAETALMRHLERYVPTNEEEAEQFEEVVESAGAVAQ